MYEQKAKNLYRALITNQKSIFYATDTVNKGLVKKARTSLCTKGKVFGKVFSEIDNNS